MVYFGAFTGDQATQRYFGPRSGGTGSMNVIGGEYNLSWAKLIRYPEEFWGEGPDLITSVFASMPTVAANCCARNWQRSRSSTRSPFILRKTFRRPKGRCSICC